MSRPTAARSSQYRLEGYAPEQRPPRQAPLFSVTEIGGHLRGNRTRKRVGQREHLSEFIVAEPAVTNDGLVTDQRNNRRPAAVAEYAGSEHAER